MKTKKVKIGRNVLQNLILDCISTEELNSKYDYSNVTNMAYMFYECSSLKDINPYNFHLYDFSNLDNKYLKEKYPELYI